MNATGILCLCGCHTTVDEWGFFLFLLKLHFSAKMWQYYLGNQCIIHIHFGLPNEMSQLQHRLYIQVFTILCA